MIKIKTKAYGEGEYVSHDPRFPGYISAKFNIKGKEIIINTLRKRDIEYILEEKEAEVIDDDFVEKIDHLFSPLGIITNHKGDFANIRHLIQFGNEQLDIWDVDFKESIDPEIGIFDYIYYYPPEDKYNLNDFLKIEEFKY